MAKRYIFITGGVISSLGKGLAASAIAALLQSHGYTVRIRKMDPYLNVDPGTMSPFEHGEVFVTEDGVEADLDLGHYERFTGVDANRNDCITQGQVYVNLLEKERRGDYLGKTVQVIPHVTDLIKQFIVNDPYDVDFMICEIGGTIGDIEAMPFLEAIRQLKYQVKPENVMYVHLTLVPYIAASKEIKSKPTQHSVKELRAIGIQPDLLLCRCEREIEQSAKDKIALFCNVNPANVVTALDVNDIYQVPMEYYKRGLNKQILEHFKLPYQEPNMHKWQQVSDKINNYQHKVTIAIVGKYNKLADSYKSLIEALHHGGLYNNTKIVLKWVNSVNLKDENVAEKLAAVDAILVPGGFGNSGVDGKICAVKYARINNIPFFGICMGVQIMVIEALRHLCGIKDANSTEFNPETTNPAVGMITEWVDRSGKYKKADTKNLGGTMRLGKYHAKLSKTSKVAKIYGVNEIDERHRHRYEINIKYKSNLEAVGMNIVGLSPDGALPEIVEYSQNDWFIGVQFHPELKSKPFAPHPLFASFVAAALNFQMKNKNE